MEVREDFPIMEKATTYKGLLLVESAYYRVSHIIGPTLFFVIFSGSGARTEELLTFIQQPWKFAT